MGKIGFSMVLLAALVFNSCGTSHEGEIKPTLLSNTISISDNEDKGIKEILAFYGGYCEYSIGVSASSQDGRKKYFEIEMSKSDLIENDANTSYMEASNVASNVALIFTKNLNNEEQNNYDEIHAVLLFKNGEKKKYQFPMKVLRLVAKKIKVADNVVEIIKRKQFDELNIILDDSTYHNYDKEKLISKLKEVDHQFGNVTEGFKSFGFSITPIENIGDVLHLSGMILRDVQNNEFSIDLDLNGTDNHIYVMQYKL